MPSSFNMITINVGSESYPTDVNANFTELANKAVHEDDLADLVNDIVVVGGDPALVQIDALNNGSMGELRVPGQYIGSANGAVVDAIDITTLWVQAHIMAFQDSRA